MLLLLRKLELMCYVLTVFLQHSWILSSPCKEFVFGGHILYRACLLSSRWAKLLVYISSEVKGPSVRGVQFHIGENLRQLLVIKICPGMYLCLFCWSHWESYAFTRFGLACSFIISSLFFLLFLVAQSNFLWVIQSIDPEHWSSDMDWPYVHEQSI